jgi:methionyl-tRNA formyltransferase|tara:strand:+ start:3028 stop:4056 length:1029 start_codon:yes stop_codon:yes gene_type:complete
MDNIFVSSQMINNNKFFIKNLSNIVFIGETPIFDKLIKFNDSVNIKSFVITSSSQSSSIKKNIDYVVHDKLDEKFKNYILKEVDIDDTLFISIGSRTIFKRDIIDFLKNNLINFHDFRLPLNAGGAGFSWQILRDDRLHNSLVHLVDEGVDTGPLLDYETTIVPNSCTTPRDWEEYNLGRFEIFYIQLIKKIIESKDLDLQPQLKYLGSYQPRLSTLHNGFIDWNLESHSLASFINAFDDPFEGASTYINSTSKKVHIKNITLHGGDSSNHPFMSGLISRHDKNWIVVSTTDKYMLLIREVLDEAGKNIINEVKVGDRFFTPEDALVKAREYRARFTNTSKK